MFEELRIFLMDNATNEERDLVTDAFSIFDDYYPPSIREGYEEYLFTQDETLVDTGEALNNIVTLTRYYLLNLLQTHEVIVNEEIDLKRLLTITEGLLAINIYEDTQTILDILNLDIDNEEKFSEIVSLMTDMSASDILIELESVSDALLTRIKNQGKETPKKEESEGDDVDAVTRIRQYYQFTPLKDLFLFDLIKNGLKVGYPFKTYIDLLGRRFESLEVNTCAHTLFAMALMSTDGFSNPKGMIHEFIGKVISDLNMITKIDIELTTLLLQYQKYTDQLKVSHPKELEHA